MRKSIFIFFFLAVLACLPVSAQVLDSSFLVKSKKITLKDLSAPALLILGGIITNGNGVEGFKKEIAEERNEHFSKFRTHVDDFLQFSPVALSHGLDAVGYRSKTDIANRSIILLKSELLMTGVVFGLKNITHQPRQDRSAFTSFPSGHTAQAFAAATFLSEEYKEKIKWMPYVAYGIASSVGILRMANNKHYISDVLIGAGIGILSTKLSYATYEFKWGKQSKTISVL